MKIEIEGENMDGIEFLKVFDSKLRSLEMIGFSIGDLATAFRNTGNESVADKLEHFSIRLVEISNELSDAKSKNLSYECSQINKSIADVFSTVLEAAQKQKETTDVVG